MNAAKKRPDKLTPHQRRARAEKAHRAGGTGKIAGYPVHPAAAELPLMPETELSELAASIKANGQRFPIMLHEGKVVDGRNRLLACEIAGVTPRTSELGNTGLVEFIADANLRRRQLKQDQRAAIAARLVRHYKSEAAKAPKPKPGKKTAPGADSRPAPKAPTVAEVAKSHGLGKRTVERALEVEKKSPELLDKVLKGEHTLKEAERHVTRGTNGDNDKNERFTPRWLIAELLKYYKLDVDAAAHPKSPATQLIGKGWTREDDGLEESWRGKRVWCNPPFDECAAWVEKAHREVLEGGCPLALMLLPAVRQEQDFWQDNIELYRDYYENWATAKRSAGMLVTTRFLRGRTRFGYPNDPEGEHSGSPEFGCVLVLFTTKAVQDLRALTGLVEPEEKKAHPVTNTPAPKLDFARELKAAGFKVNEKRGEINCVVCAQWWPLLIPLPKMTRPTFDAFMHHANEHGLHPKAAPCACVGFEPAESSLSTTCVCGHPVEEHGKEAGPCSQVAKAAPKPPSAKFWKCVACSSTEQGVAGELPKGWTNDDGKYVHCADCNSAAGPLFGMTAKEAAPDKGARKKKGQSRSEREADQMTAWRKELGADVPAGTLNDKCSAADCSSAAALGEEKCAAHLVLEDDEAECGARGPNGETCIEPKGHKGIGEPIPGVEHGIFRVMHRTAKGELFTAAAPPATPTRKRRMQITDEGGAK